MPAPSDPPLTCALWKHPEATLARGLEAQFERLEIIARDSHWWRYLLKCRGCGQLYVYDFLETVDWHGGEDPQRATWVPVTTSDQIARAKTAPPGAMRAFTPRLCRDWPKGQEKPSLVRVG